MLAETDLVRSKTMERLAEIVIATGMVENPVLLSAMAQVSQRACSAVSYETGAIGRKLELASRETALPPALRSFSCGAGSKAPTPREEETCADRACCAAGRNEEVPIVLSRTLVREACALYGGRAECYRRYCAEPRPVPYDLESPQGQKTGLFAMLMLLAETPAAFARECESIELHSVTFIAGVLQEMMYADKLTAGALRRLVGALWRSQRQQLDATSPDIFLHALVMNGIAFLTPAARAGRVELVRAVFSILLLPPKSAGDSFPCDAEEMDYPDEMGSARLSWAEQDRRLGRRIDKLFDQFFSLSRLFQDPPPQLSTRSFRAEASRVLARASHNFHLLVGVLIEGRGPVFAYMTSLCSRDRWETALRESAASKGGGPVDATRLQYKIRAAGTAGVLSMLLRVARPVWDGAEEEDARRLWTEVARTVHFFSGAPLSPHGKPLSWDALRRGLGDAALDLRDAAPPEACVPSMDKVVVMCLKNLDVFLFERVLSKIGFGPGTERETRADLLRRIDRHSPSWPDFPDYAFARGVVGFYAFLGDMRDVVRSWPASAS